MTEQVGHTGCAPVGTTAEGAACTDADASANGGADTCAAGDLCIAGKCKPICDPGLAAGAAKGACDADHACALYSGVFVAGANATAGVCEPGCDPLTQQLKIGGAEACGSADPTMPDATCVPSSGFESFLCAPSGSDVYGNTDRKPALTSLGGDVFANGCAPGYIPLLPLDNGNGVNTIICMGLCAPVKVNADLAGDTNPARINEGDTTALGKLTADPVAVSGHATCAGDVKGSPTEEEDCRYLWRFLVPSNTPITESLRTPTSDTVGFCYAFGRYLFDDDNDSSTADVPDKSCAALPDKAAATDFFGSAADDGCYSLTDTLAQQSPATARRAQRHVPHFRMSYGNAKVARHIFD
jgi:hypothetical protein